jgi:hypothetical protein
MILNFKKFLNENISNEYKKHVNIYKSHDIDYYENIINNENDITKLKKIQREIEEWFFNILVVNNGIIWVI